MKQIRLYIPLILATLLAITYQQSSYADLTASQIQAQFNSLNSGLGFTFNVNTTAPGAYMAGFSSIGAGELQLINAPTTNQIPDLSAYTSNTAGSNWFRTFCVTPEISFAPSGSNSGKLNYTNGNSMTATAYDSSYNQIPSMALSLGAAYLYKQYATGALNYSYTDTGTAHYNDARDLQVMIWYLMGRNTVDGVDIASTITTNKYYIDLTTGAFAQAGYTLTDAKAAYNVDSNYNGLMGDYKVFVMNTEALLSRSGQAVRQDVLYIAKSGGVTPEPGTLAIWALGSLGFIGCSACRQRFSSKKNA